MNTKSLNLLKRVKVTNLFNFNKTTLSGVITKYTKFKYEVDDSLLIDTEELSN